MDRPFSDRSFIDGRVAFIPREGLQYQDGEVGTSPAREPAVRESSTQMRRLELCEVSTPYRSATPRIGFVLHEAICLVAQPVREEAVGESRTESSVLKATGINIPYRQAGVVREYQPASAIRPRCSCNESSRSALEGRSSRPSPLRATIPTTRRIAIGLLLSRSAPCRDTSSHGDRQMSGRKVTSQTSHRPACLLCGCTLVAVVLALGYIQTAPKRLTRKASCQSQQGNNGNACPRQPHIAHVSPTSVSSGISWLTMSTFEGCHRSERGCDSAPLSRNWKAKALCHLTVLSRHRIRCRGRRLPGISSIPGRHHSVA
jgi:hypothetical protein